MPTSALLTRVPPTVLASIAEGLASVTDSDSLILAPGADRGFRRLLGTDAYDAWLIAWAPGGTLDLHDHGGSAGSVVVVEGELMERYTDRLQPTPVGDPASPTGPRPGHRPTRVHGVWNPGPAPRCRCTSTPHP